jgi:hypothetical protein
MVSGIAAVAFAIVANQFEDHQKPRFIKFGDKIGFKLGHYARPKQFVDGEWPTRPSHTQQLS